MLAVDWFVVRLVSGLTGSFIFVLIS